MPDQDRDIETRAGWPTSHEMIDQLREALGLFSGAMPVSPEQAWEEALAEVRRLWRDAGTARERIVSEIRANDQMAEALADAREREKRLQEQHERELGEVIDERDQVQQAADKLAYAIATPEVIGEHSSGNDPWENALDHIVTKDALDAARKESERLKPALADLVEAVEENLDPQDPDLDAALEGAYAALGRDRAAIERREVRRLKRGRDGG